MGYLEVVPLFLFGEGEKMTIRLKCMRQRIRDSDKVLEVHK